MKPHEVDMIEIELNDFSEPKQNEDNVSPQPKTNYQINEEEKSGR